MDDLRPVYDALIQAQERGERAALVTVVHVVGSVPRHAGSKMLVREDGSIVGTVGGGKMEALVIDAARALAGGEGAAHLLSYSLNDIEAGDPGVCGGTVQVFLEPVNTPPTLLVIGIGHVGRALAELGKWSGFRVVVCDDRADLCNAEALPGMDGYVVCKPGAIAQQMAITTATYVAAVTRGLPVDIDLVPALLATPAPYIGIIGSRRRWALTARTLRQERGLSDADLKRIRAPIGLELSAETPKEIAVSIIAEIIMLRRGGTGQPMAWHGRVEEAEQVE